MNDEALSKTTFDSPFLKHRQEGKREEEKQEKQLQSFLSTQTE